MTSRQRPLYLVSVSDSAANATLFHFGVSYSIESLERGGRIYDVPGNNPELGSTGSSANNVTVKIMGTLSLLPSPLDRLCSNFDVSNSLLLHIQSKHNHHLSLQSLVVLDRIKIQQSRFCVNRN